MNNHDDIKDRKTLSSLLESEESFSQLRNMLLLFNKDSEYYKFSGIVTAALLDFEISEEGEDLSILAISCGMINQWNTFKCSRTELEKMLNCCDAFIGASAKMSFLLKK